MSDSLRTADADGGGDDGDGGDDDDGDGDGEEAGLQLPPAKSPRPSPAKSPPPLDLLMLASNPDGAPGGMAPLGEVTREAHELRQAMPLSSFELASSPAQLGKVLGTVPARIVVYSGHGDAQLTQHGPRTLCLTSPSGAPALVQPDTLRNVFGGIAARRTLRLVVLNGCDTLALGRAALDAGVPFVLCWESAVPDAVARPFVVAFIKAVQQQVNQGGQRAADYEAALSLAKNKLCSIVRPGHNSHGQAFDVPTWEFRAPELQCDPWTGEVKDVSVSTADFTPPPLAAGVPCLLRQPWCSCVWGEENKVYVADVACCLCPRRRSGGRRRRGRGPRARGGAACLGARATGDRAWSTNTRQWWRSASADTDLRALRAAVLGGISAGSVALRSDGPPLDVCAAARRSAAATRAQSPKAHARPPAPELGQPVLQP